MKKLILLCLLTVAVAAADVNWYYTVESIPGSLPGSGTGSDGIIVLVKMPVEDASVCVDFTAPDGAHHVCAGVSDNTVYAYASAYVSLGFDAADVTVDSISVTSGGETKSVDRPAPALEY